MSTLAQLRLLIEAYQRADSVQTGKYRTTINELTDQIPATRPDLLRAAGALLVSELHSLEDRTPLSLRYDKLLSEEDKGAGMAAVACIMAQVPLAMARPYAYPLPGAIPVDYKMEYSDHTVYLNGLKHGDRVLLIDDTLSTGGTACALIQAANNVGAVITDMRVLIEKIGNGGRERLLKEAGVNVSAVLGIRVPASGTVIVEEIFGQPMNIVQYGGEYVV